MPTREITSTDWNEFCKRFAKDQRGYRVTVESVHSDGTRVCVADNLPLQEIVFERSHQCNDYIYLLLGDPHDVTHTIVEPIHLKIQSEDGLDRVLRIEAESGITLIHFSTDKLSEVLKGLNLS